MLEYSFESFNFLSFLVRCERSVISLLMSRSLEINFISFQCWIYTWILFGSFIESLSLSHVTEQAAERSDVLGAVRKFRIGFLRCRKK